MNEETLASVLSGVVRRRAPHESKDLTCAIAICDECGRAQAKGRRKAVGLAALKMYTSECPCVYVELNAAMRNNDAAAIEPYGRYVRTMVEAMLVSPRFEGSTVYRGIKLDMRAACKKGSTLVWPEFASCTSSIETQETFLGPTGDRTLFVLTLTQGRARSIADVSMIPGESEVLLPPNTRITVESAYCAGNGLVLVNASEVPTECMLAALEIAEAAEAAEAAQAQAQAKAEAAKAAEAARKEAECKEAARKEAERKAAERKEAERKAAERKAAERKETERKAAERKAAELKDAERIKAEAGEAERSEEVEAGEAERSEEVEAERIEEVEAGEAEEVEATKKAKRRRYITVCVVLARITWFVTRVTLIGAGKAVWLVARLISFVVQWLFESDERGHGDHRGRPNGGSGDRPKRGSGGRQKGGRGGRPKEEGRGGRPKGGSGGLRPEADREELVTPSIVSASASAMGGLVVIIAAAHLLTRLCEYRERRAFLF
jgi:hypothetical protein